MTIQIELQEETEACLVVFQKIIFQQKTYFLHKPLVCVFETDHTGAFLIQNENIEIFAVGETLEKSKKDFAEQFDFKFQRFAELSNDQLSKHLGKIKLVFQNIVKHIQA